MIPNARIKTFKRKSNRDSNRDFLFSNFMDFDFDTFQKNWCREFKFGCMIFGTSLLNS